MADVIVVNDQTSRESGIPRLSIRIVLTSCSHPEERYQKSQGSCQVENLETARLYTPRPFQAKLRTSQEVPSILCFDGVSWRDCP